MALEEEFETEIPAGAHGGGAPSGRTAG